MMGAAWMNRSGAYILLLIAFLAEPHLQIRLNSHALLPAPVRLYPLHRAYIESSEIIFAWEPVEGAARYRFELARAGGGGNDRLDVWTARTAYTARGLMPEATYVWCVTAVNAAGQEGRPCRYYREVTTSSQVIVPLSPPALFADEGRYHDRVRLFWQAAPRATHYQIERSPADEGTEAAAAPAKVGTSKVVYFEDFEVEPGTRYAYTVSACNPAGCSPPSPADVGWAGLCSTMGIPQPERPGHQALVITGGRLLELRWSPVEHAREYEYQVQKLPVENRQVEAGGSNRISVQALIDGPGEYRWRVRALDPAIGCRPGKWSPFSAFRIAK